MKTKIAAMFFGLVLVGGCGNKSNDTAAPAEPEPTEQPAEQPAEPTPPPEAEATAPKSATATLASKSDSKVAGTVTFTETADGKVEVTAELSGLKPGEHGFHIHETGDCSAPDAKSAGGHFAPEGHPHGAPTAEMHHAGDFGNVTAGKDGTAKGTWTVDYISFEGANSIVGKAVVVHAKADDLKSQPSGAAGARVACGVIEAQDAAAAAEPAAPATEPTGTGD